MTRLKCNISDCVSNKDNLCCRPYIDVGGTNACSCGETCCDSYMKKTGNATNSADFSSPNAALEINCKAQNCVHNKSGKCHAGLVNISNGSNGTECASFKEKSC